MERIAPLAKILAEANGIDWQTLRGSGEGGMVVEQDILNYLSRIMSGEEEPPSTPVDVPPADWNGDVNAMPDLSGMSSEQLSRAGVDSDMAALLNQARPPVSPEVPSTPATPELDAEDMDFELDDDVTGEMPGEAAAPAAPMAPVAATPAMPTWDFSAPAPQAAAPTAAPSMPAAPMPEVPMPDLQMPAATAPVAAAGVAAAGAGLGSLLSRLYQQTPAPAAPLEPAESAPAHSETAHSESAHSESASPDEAAADAGAFSSEEAHSGAPHSSFEVSDHTDDAQEQPALAAEPVVMDTPAIEAGTVEATTGETSTAEASTGPDERPAPEPVAAAEEPEAPAEPQAQTAPQDAQAEPAPEAEAATAAPAPAAQASGAVWFGTYLRRSVDFGAASALHGQLSRALGQDVPLAFLVARAVQRHAAALGLSSVALHDNAQNRARSVAGEHLRAAVDALAHTYEGTPDLLVVDAGALDLDDLHYPHTVTLSVGRVHDGRAALTLNGPVDAAQGARFLADLDATLREPILLVL
ncbi:E3 binding domain-containing protein [Deinococcus koreensis]|uniref:Peripheral subunit-binding (PSBD) domain-containing protein n=1 Tax=Deinococcus koreensis TaxID=2054903 RepID=A0A2K3UYY5_9DEIO|nr:E3 binding domain-containing protein [Deinococcus koreensis]PNY81743.1 hypothetical protein CVO96_10470 [Deinococcus koreensis]